MTSEPHYRVLAVSSHPVQYSSPLFARMATHPNIDLEVAYCSLKGATPTNDPDFGVSVKWDIPLLSGYRWVHVPNLGSGSDAFWGLVNPSIRKIISEGRFDAVLCHVSYTRATFWITLFAARAAGAAFLFGTDATTLTARDGSEWKSALKRRLWPRLFLAADQIVVPSSGSYDLIHSLGIPAERITLTPYTVDNAWWFEEAAKVNRMRTRSSWGITGRERVVLFCAKLQSWKRPLDLLRAFAIARITDSVLVFAGDGPLRGQLESEAAALGITARVHFLGFMNQSELPAVYSASDVMVLPSEYEPFGVVVNEAMCCGCPVIAGDRVGAVRDLILPVSPRFVFPTRDVNRLAETLCRALDDMQGLKQIGSACAAHIRTWSPERNISATVQAIERGKSHAELRRGGKRHASVPPLRDSSSSVPQDR